MYRLAPNIDLLFTEAGEAPDRVRAAAAAGFDAVEMWGPTGKDIPALRFPARAAVVRRAGGTGAGRHRCGARGFGPARIRGLGGGRHRAQPHPATSALLSGYHLQQIVLPALVGKP